MAHESFAKKIPEDQTMNRQGIKLLKLINIDIWVCGFYDACLCFYEWLMEWMIEFILYVRSVLWQDLICCDTYTSMIVLLIDWMNVCPMCTNWWMSFWAYQVWLNV